MGTNNPNLPNNVLSDEEAIQYLAAVLNAIRVGNYAAVTGSPTATAAQMVGGAIDVSGGSTATLTTDTATAIVAQMNALQPGSGVAGATASCTIINDNSGALTVTGGTGVTLSGNSPTSIAAGAARRYLIKVVSGTAVNMYAY
jgi:hypothetical protein